MRRLDLRARVAAAPQGVGDVLLACVRGDGAGVDLESVRWAVARADVAEIPAATRYHRVVAPVYTALQRAGGVDAETLAVLRALYREGTRARFRAVRSLHHVRDVFGETNVRWLSFKGPVLSDAIYRQPNSRLFHDVDVLVRPADFERALTTFEKSGFRLLDRNWHFHRRWISSELRLAARDGAEVDLHWHLLISRAIRRYFRIPIDEMIDRSRVVRVHEMEVQTFDEVDTVLHLAIHAALEGGDRLVWLKDLEQAAAFGSLDWDVLVARAHDWRVNILVGTMLSRVRTVLHAQIPPVVLRDLLPNAGWRTAVRTADYLFPPQRSNGRGSPSTHLARNARVNGRTTLAASWSDARRIGRQFLAGERWRRATWNSDRFLENAPADPQSKTYPAGDAADRASFLAAIADESSTV